MKLRFFILLCLYCLYLMVPIQVFADTSALSQALGRMQVTVPKKPQLAPDFTLPDLKQGTVRLSDYRGKLVLLNFWASFCDPCRREMPGLENLWQHYRHRGLAVLALSADRDNLKQVETFINKGGYHFPVLLDTEGYIRKKYEIRALPTTYLIGRDGRFIGRVIGERAWDSVQGQQLIERLLLQSGIAKGSLNRSE